MKQALALLRNKLVTAIRHFKAFAEEYASLPCLSYTHFQPAQPTTVGKRACLWIQDLLIDLHDMEHLLSELHFLGVKGATGTQASFLHLLDGDADKVKQLDTLVAQEMGFSKIFSISGQTYTRKQDIRIMNGLSSFASSAHKCATDLRLLAHLKEIEEPFASTQVGSSAMPYKRNPMRSERICGIARFLISLHDNALYTEATQWLERTLDDSSNRRLYIPQAFLAADAILNLLCHLSSGLIVYPKTIAKHLEQELPFLATEHLLMEAVKKGKDRQEVHERLRVHSLEAGRRVKEEAHPCDLLERIAADPHLGFSKQELAAQTKPELLVGRSVEQTREFIASEVDPLLARYQTLDPFTPAISI
jgi:adenylosuccinate lyase